MANVKLQKQETSIINKIFRYEKELEGLRKAITWRRGINRRFNSNATKINRRSWLISKLAELKTQLNTLDNDTIQ